MASSNNKRYSGLTRDEQARRRSTTQALRTRNLFRTTSDNPNVSTSALQRRLANSRGRQKGDTGGAYIGGNSFYGKRAERISKKGNAVVGKKHASRYREIRAALGLSSG